VAPLGAPTDVPGVATVPVGGKGCAATPDVEGGVVVPVVAGRLGVV